MNTKELNTEQIILEAAEAEFLEKGYGNAKMMAIAKRANVSHSMLHYYFRNKENLFQTIFQKKAQTIASSFGGILEQSRPFLETLRSLIEVQFDFVAQNPQLPHFMLTEIVSSKENRALLFEILAPKVFQVIPTFEKMLNDEIKRGTIRPIKFFDLLINIVSINVSTFIVFPILQEMTGRNVESIHNLLVERRENNVQFILAALRA